MASTIRCLSAAEREDPPVQVAWASNQFEAELIRGFLAAGGVNCLPATDYSSGGRGFSRNSRRIRVAASDRNRGEALLAEAAEKDESE